MKRFFPIAISFGLLFAAIYMKLQEFPIVEQLTYTVFDAYQRYYPREYNPDIPVRIIDIDDASLAKMGQWPWPRPLIADMVTRLKEEGVAAVAFDMVFAEPDRTSPEHIARMWEKNIQELLHNLPDHDQLFAEAISDAGNIITGFVLTNDAHGILPSRPFGSSYVGPSGAKPEDFLLTYSAATTTLPILTNAAAGNGFFNALHDNDGKVRRMPLMMQADDIVYASLGMEALRVAQGARSYTVKLAGASGEKTYGESTGITHIRNGAFNIPTDSSGNMYVYYTEHADDRYISAWKLFDKTQVVGDLQGSIVFVGTSAPGLKDLRNTPVNPALPGVEVHAQMLEQVLSDSYLKRPDIILAVELMLMVVAGLVLMVMMAKLSAVWGAIFMVAVQAIGIGFSLYIFTDRGWLIDPVSPSLVVFLLYINESLRRYIVSENERKQVRAAFSQYMSPALVKQLAKNPDKLTLGGETREMTMLFCDIRGFTTISEQYNAQGLTRFINQFLTPMTDVILMHRGTIDKYMGDCIMAFWNAPLSDKQHETHAAQAALGMLQALQKLNHYSEHPVQIGIGINSGEVCVGNMGSDQRFDYSVLGDEVNLSARLEGQSKYYGVDIVIGENTQQALEGFATLEIDCIQVKGKTQAVTIYTLLGDQLLQQNDAYQALAELWNKVLIYYRAQQWDSALNYIALCKTQNEKLEHVNLNGLYACYTERIARYKVTPPPDNWDGVYIAQIK